MLSQHEIMQTIQMIDQQHLDEMCIRDSLVTS